MVRSILMAGLAFGAVSLLCTSALAQGFGGGGTGGVGGGGFGGTAAGGGGGAFGTGGGTFGGGTGFGGGGFGGSTGFGGTGFGGGGGFGGNTAATGNSGFSLGAQGQSQFMLGQQQAAGGGFVGRTAQNAGTFLGGQTGGQFQQQQQFNNLQRGLQNQQNRGLNGGAAGGDMPQVQVGLQVGFDYPTPTVASLNADLSGSAMQILRSRVADPNLEIVGQTVILRGTVASEDEKRLAERILSLRPGVNAVQNELQVVPSSAGPPAE